MTAADTGQVSDDVLARARDFVKQWQPENWRWDANDVAAALAAERARAVADLRAAMEELAAPGDPNVRMHAYYYGFEPTGVGVIDAILSAVATAGKHYHGTEYWADEYDGRPSEEQCIQAAADAAAASLRAVLDATSQEQQP